MRIFRFIVALSLSLLWILALDRPIDPLPALGRFFSPAVGLWANAEPNSKPEQYLQIPEPAAFGNIRIRLDERMVPHIQAQNDEGLYFAQGYLHARDRLWQMDMQTRAASGRLSEIVGEQTLAFDRMQRRKGMLWAAENSLEAMQQNPVTRKILTAYTAGINAYIHSLRYKDLPLEYKLMNFRPEDWTALKCALLLKYMADDLTGKTDDIALSYVHDALSEADFQDLYPDHIQNSIPVIPTGTVFMPPSAHRPSIPRGRVFSDFSVKDSLNASWTTPTVIRGSSGLGSNNWVVGAPKTASGNTILCNDPHLGLNLPSIWYEIQLSAPGINCYGVSIPGAPGIVIGFNDSISWGLTNNYRDVKDYYEIRTEDPRFYILDNKKLAFHFRHEHIIVKGRETPFVDTVRYSIHGPLLYDERFPEPSGSGKTLAMTWMAHRATNELFSLYALNRAQNYNDFVSAIRHFECPAQNFIFADCYGNIAIWGQGRFINKWKNQGRFVMRGDISATLWGDTIPMMENPHALNPAQHYLASANQQVTGPGYPYYYNGDFSEFRSWAIHHFLKDSNRINVQDMMALQNNNWSPLAHLLLPYFYLYGRSYSSDQGMYLQAWNDSLMAESKTGSAFQIWWHFLYEHTWKDEFSGLPQAIYPAPERTLQLILEDTGSRYFDDIRTPEKETFAQIAGRSFQLTWDSIHKLEHQGGSQWYQVKNTSVTHLARIGAFSFSGLKTGGWGHTINAMKHTHGPSWRMIVEMKRGSIRAWAVYPGGQSGNPGSRFYANFLDHWVAGKYYEISLDGAE